MIIVKEVKSKTKIKQFVKFPFDLYKGSKYWVPPIIKDEISSFNPLKNPTLKDAEISLFLAYKKDKIVGRVAAIINWIEVNDQKTKKMRFGWFDFIDDVEVSKALLDKVSEIGTSNNLEYMEGPVGFSNLDKVGVLTYGFDHIGTMVSWYNYEYYKNHLEALSFIVEKEYVEHNHDFRDIKIENYNRLESVIKKRYGLRALNFNKTKEMMRYADKMFDLFNESYSSLSSFVRITESQKNYMKNKFLNFINPEYIKFVCNKDEKLVGFAVVMPSFAKSLQKIKGKLYPFGIFELLKARKSKAVNFLLIGVHPEYQNKGVHAIIFSEYHRTFNKFGIKECRRTPELSDNLAVQKLWTEFNPKLIKKRCTYKKYISETTHP